MDFNLSNTGSIDNGLTHYVHAILTDFNGLTRENLLDLL